MRRASDIAPKPIRWLVRDHLPKGDLVMLAGDTGTGKSQIAAHLVACVSKGKPFAYDIPVEVNAKGKVLLFTGERSTSRVVRPRLQAASADLAKVLVNDAVASLEDIAEMVSAEKDVRLVVIDPVNSFLSGSHSNAKIRKLLAPLAALADKSGITFLLVHHLSKNSNGRSLTNLVGGSNAWVESVSSVWMCAKMEDGGVLEQIKANLGQTQQRYEYWFEPHVLPNTRIKTSRVVIGDVAQTSIQDLMRPNDLPHRLSALDNAVAWLKDYLGSGPVWSKTVEGAASKANISRPTLKRAKLKADVRSKKQKGEWVWFLESLESVEQDDQGAQGTQRLLSV